MTLMQEITWQQRKSVYSREYFDGSLPGHYRDWWWTDFSVWGPRARVVFEAFRPRRCLVCGCAKGSLVKFLHGIYHVDALGFDLSEYAINTTPYPDIRDRLFVHDLATERLPCDDQDFDVVTCYDFLEHNDDEHFQFVCDEVARVAAKNILIRAPIVALSDSEASQICLDVHGLPLSERLKLLKSRLFYREWQPDSFNLEHPNTKPRAELVEHFPAFRETALDSYYYDIMMGNNASQTPVLPFYDTIILERNV